MGNSPHSLEKARWLREKVGKAMKGGRVQICFL